jgi:hypothetical protein
MVVDAGSTGSRVHLFHYERDASGTPVHIQPLWSNRVSPGLATLAANSTTINAYLTTLFANDPATTIPVYFYATAGMRVLPLPEQERYYQLMTHWFSQSTHPLLAAKTISGQEEGVFAWLSVALETGALTADTWSQLGVLDTGGVSVQIVFPQPLPVLHNPNTVQLTVYGQPITLFSYSALALGKTSVMEQFSADEACVQYVGHGDIQQCNTHVADWIHTQFKVEDEVKPQVQQHSDLHWTVLGGLAYLPLTPALQLPPGEFSIATLYQQADTQVCALSWDNAVTWECLHAAYYHALLVSGFGLSEQTSLDPRLGQAGNDWALGVVLLHTP